MLFANGMGAAGDFYGVLICLAIWLFFFFVAIAGVIKSYLMLRKGSNEPRWQGYTTLVLSIALPFFCCFSPSYFYQIAKGGKSLGFEPRERVHLGMTRDEVREVLGNPHEQPRSSNSECWYYYYGVFMNQIISVQFDENGRVEGTHRID